MIRSEDTMSSISNVHVYIASFVVLLICGALLWVVCSGSSKLCYPGVDKALKFNVLWTLVSFIDFYSCILFVIGMLGSHLNLNDLTIDIYILLILITIVSIIAQYILSLVLLYKTMHRLKKKKNRVFMAIKI